MTVPKQVLEASEMAEQLHSEIFSTEVNTNEDVDTATLSEEQEPTSNLKTTPDESIVDAEEDEEETYKARYKTLQGKYNAEIPRLSQELRELKTSVFEKLKAPAEKEAPTEKPETETSDFLESFSENYGEDFAENLRKLISLEAAKLTQPMQQKIEATEETQVKAAQTSFVDYIDTQLNEGREKPVNWQDLWAGKDPKFVEFLAQPDPSGLYTMGELAELYNKNWEADKLVNIFKMYTDSNITTKPTPKAVNTQKDALVAPSRNNTHTAPDTTAKKVWTNDMVNEFQRLDRQGKYSADESKVLWDDLLSALSEGRIR